LALDPDLVEAQVARGRGLFAEGRYEEARQVLEVAVSRAPRMDRAWEYLGRTELRLGQYEAGLAALRRAIDLEPKNVQHLNYLGNFYLYFKENDKAIAAYRRATELKPDDPMAWNNLGAAYLRLGDYPHAAESFQRLLETKEDADARTNLGNACFYSGQFDRAVEEYRTATELEPRRAVYWGNLGDGLLAAGRPAEAPPCFAKAVELTRQEVTAKPMDVNARRRLALWCARAGDRDCAIQEGRIAAELAPDDGEVHFTNAIVYCILGRLEEALASLERAAQLGVTQAAIESEPALQPLRSTDAYQRIVQLAS
jgi:tetratricopeptide (TPR) repeat protein